MSTASISAIGKVIRGVSWDKGDASDTSRLDYLPILRAGNIGLGLNINDDLVWVPASNVSSEQKIRAGDIAICMSSGSPAVVGKTALAASDWSGSVGAFCALIRANPAKCLPEYLAFFLKSPRFRQWASEAQGASIKNIRKSALEGFEIWIPALPEQHRIVDLLSRAESIVRLRREAEKKAAELIPALFVDMFGDPATNPRGWPAATLGNVVDEFRYGTSQKSGPTGFPVLRIPNVIGNQLVPSGMKMVEVPKAEADRLRLLDGDFLFVRTNGNPDYVGRSAVYDSSIMQQAGFNGADTLYASYLIRARIQAATLDPYFLQSYLSSTEGRRKLKERCRTSAGQFNINTDGLASIPILIPPMSIQLDFVQRYRDVFSIQSQQSVATATAQATFDALLARCFTLSPSEYCPKAPHPS